MEYSTEHLDYLSRAYLDRYNGYVPDQITRPEIFLPPDGSVQFVHLPESSRSWREIAGEYQKPETQSYRTEAILAGLFGTKIPVLFSLEGQGVQLRVCLGICAPLMLDNRDRGEDSGLQILQRSLVAYYPGLCLRNVDEQNRFLSFHKANYYGLLTGFPTRKMTDETDSPTQLDLLIRAMADRHWGLLVIAQPLNGSQVNAQLHATTNEMLQVENAEQTKQRRGPIAEHYFQSLECLAKEFQQGLAIGLWTTSLYFYADTRESFDCLAANLTACFGGQQSLPDPVRTLECPSLARIIPSFGHLLQRTDPPPGSFQYPYRFQTLLNSERLATLIHLPRLETPGFTIRDSARLDVACHQPADKATVDLGAIYSQGQAVGNRYVLTPRGLNRHALIVGVTGSGKTTTSKYLIRKLWQQRIPFLVIEPAKKEYCSLLADPIIGPDLAVFTLGNEKVTPLRLNPFEFAGVSLSSHIDLLKSVFNAAFSMWTVLPQILEQSLHAVYREYGWDVVRNENERLKGSETYRQEAFPTLTDLHQTISTLVDRLGYEPNTTSELKAALLTRIQSLRIGGKGKMLDTREPFSVERLFEKPAVIELEDVGDDDEKAFLIGLLLVRVYEYLRSRRPDADARSNEERLKHVVVVEEAHRLLTNVELHTSADVANTRGKAVETFVNMLSEVRAYGEGFFVVEQIPSKLNPDVIKNTNVKIVHRTVAGDDRKLMGMAMNMTERQSDMLAVIGTGEAAVFSEGDDRPILVKIEKQKPYEPGAASEAFDISAVLMRQATSRFPDITKDCAAGCLKYTKQPSMYCDTAQDIAEQDHFQQAVSFYLLSLVEEPAYIIDGLAGLLERARRYYPGVQHNEALVRSVLIHGLDHHLKWLGRSYQWPFEGVASLRDGLIPTVLEAHQILQSEEGAGTYDDQRLADYRQNYLRLCKRDFDPFPQCALICDQRPDRLCLYRYQAAALLNNKRIHNRFISAIQTARSPSDMLNSLRVGSLEVGGLCAAPSIPLEDQKRIALCFAVQKLTTLQINPSLQDKLAGQLIAALKPREEE